MARSTQPALRLPGRRGSLQRTLLQAAGITDVLLSSTRVMSRCRPCTSFRWRVSRCFRSLLPRWLGYLGCVIAALELLCGLDTAVWTGTLALDGAVMQLAFPAFVLWVLAACVAMLVRIPAAADIAQ